MKAPRDAYDATGIVAPAPEILGSIGNVEIPDGEPGLLDLPETLALAEKSIAEMLMGSPSDNIRLRAAELVMLKHQTGTPDTIKAMATKEDIEHLRSIIGEVKTVLEGHVGFYERKYGSRSPAVGLEGTS